MRETLWYVIQVKSGTEESIRVQCERLIPKELAQRCFIPYYEYKRKIEGSWRVLQKILIPGYLFLVSDNALGLKQELHRIIGFTKLLATGEDIQPLSEKDVEFLQRMGGEEQVVAMSEGDIILGKTVVRVGPLKGMEAQIRRIDRHKRKAWLEVEMFGRTQMVEVGLEIVNKS